MPESFFFCVCYFVIGACLGSFLNASALRLNHPQETILHPSRCRGCDRSLTWKELVPVVSWICQRGQCACQKIAISPQYILAELGLGITFVVLYQVTATLPDMIFYGVLSSCLFFCLLTDALHQLLHLPVMLFCLAVGLVYAWQQDQLMNAVIGASVGFFLLWGINWVYKKCRHQDGLGGGDKYLLAALGGWFGFPAVVEILVLASWLGAAWVLLLIIKNIPATRLPLGVFFVLATPLIALKIYT